MCTWSIAFLLNKNVNDASCLHQRRSEMIYALKKKWM
jgi:hypothetical protein